MALAAAFAASVLARVWLRHIDVDRPWRDMIEERLEPGDVVFADVEEHVDVALPSCAR